jgi:hypothetical protein
MKTRRHDAGQDRGRLRHMISGKLSQSIENAADK